MLTRRLLILPAAYQGVPEEHGSRGERSPSSLPTPRDRSSEVMPAPQALTVRDDYLLVELPDDCYAPRRFDPRVAFFRLTVCDHASPITSPWKRAGSSATGVKDRPER